VIKFQTSSHLQWLVHPAAPPTTQQPTQWGDSFHICLWGWCTESILCKWCQYRQRCSPECFFHYYQSAASGYIFGNEIKI